MRIGIYAGAFDPVHNGHIGFAKAAAETCKLDKIIFLPERQPRGKDEVTDFIHRVAMLKLATATHGSFEVCELRVPQFSVQYTLPELQTRYPGERLTLLVGSDNVRNMSPITWPNVAYLYKTADIAVGMREGDTLDGMHHIAKQANLTYVYTNLPHAASTKVRAGNHDLIHPQVADYILKNKLYKA